MLIMTVSVWKDLPLPVWPCHGNFGPGNFGPLDQNFCWKIYEKSVWVEDTHLGLFLKQEYKRHQINEG